MTITQIKKRDNRLVDFNAGKITEAINKAFVATYKPGQGETAERLSRQVVDILEQEGNSQPTVEHVQDTVEKVLMELDG